MAVEGQRRRPRPLSIASLLLFIAAVTLGAAVVAPRSFADAKSTSTTTARSRVPYREPTPAEGGKVVHYNLTLGVAKRAPDCYLRDVYTINGQFGGPTIEVHRGDVLHVTLVNEVPADYPQVHVGATLHWHGLSMKGSDAWYDGVAFVHQCPLQSKAGSNRQEIKFRIVDGPGLFWYHSHTGLSSVDGIFGPLVIRPPRENTTMAAETEGGQGAAAAAAAALAKENPALGGDIDREFLVLFGDWYHSTSGALGFATGRPFDTRKANATTGDYGWVDLPQAMLINGRGVFQDCALGGPTDNSTTCSPLPVGSVPAGRNKHNPFAVPSNPGCSRTNFTVSAGKKYLFRLLNVGSLTDASLCFGGHDSVTVVSADGTPVEPFKVRAKKPGQGACVEVNLAQRIGVVLEASREPGSVHWVTAAPHFRAGAPNGYAVLRYVDEDGRDDGRKLPDPKLAPQPGAVSPWTLDELRRIRTPAWLLGNSSAEEPPAGVVPPLAALPKKEEKNGAANRTSPPRSSSFSLAVPQTANRTVTLNMTQPFLATGQVRWALNQVVQADTPFCGEYMKFVREKGYGDAVERPALAAAKSVAATLEAVAQNSPNPPPFPDVGVSLGMQQVEGNKLDSKQAPTFLSYGEDASGNRIYADGDDDGNGNGEGKDGKNNKERPPPSSALLPAPQVGRHVIRLRLGEVVDVVMVNLPPETNQGPFYSRPKDAPVNIEMHPMHIHYFSHWVLGFGWGDYDGKNASLLNLKDPPYRDVSMLPGFKRDKGWLHIRFVADNPSTALFHCHTSWHLLFGQALQFVVAPEEIPAQPSGMPSCPSECAASIATWDQVYVNKIWGSTNYDIGPVANRSEARG